VALVVGATASQARAAAAFTRALTDDVWFDGIGQSWMPRTIATGAGIALLEIDWASVEPRPPAAGFDPTNPAAPNYSFGYVDAIVRQFAGTGIAPAFLVTDAPRWAEAPGGPSELEAAGAWEPNAAAFGQLATALARRYSGSYPDPGSIGRALPRVRYYQAWAEANFSIHLAPQWINQGGAWVPASPGIYRNMLNAFYAGIKSAHPDNVVISTGTGPYGDDPGPYDPANPQHNRMRPVEFVRNMLCLHGQALRAMSCPNPAHFDVLAHDPYDFSSPTTPAVLPDDASAPDIGKLGRVANRAVRLGLAQPRTHKRLWVTEFSWDSNPPNPSAISLATQARWLEQAFYVYWREGVDTAVWYLVRDQACCAYNTSYYSGLYFRNGAPKPAAEAYRFPFVVMGSTAWGMSPRSGKVSVQRQRGGRWRTLFRVGVASGGVFAHHLSANLHGSFRAVVGGESSLVWSR
jgi:hypothetical protein